MKTLTAVTASMLLAAPLCALPAESDITVPTRTTRSADGFEVMRGEAPFRDRSTFVETTTTQRERAGASEKSDSRVAAVALEEAWIYDASVELFDDFDGDGYFQFIRVKFDADSIYADHYVYARLFITIDGVTWDEYHVTDDFLIDGTSPFDDYEVETELVAGFETGLYDVLIELYDADLGHFLAEFGPADSSAFSLLPLEDADHDFVNTVVVISEEHGGGGSTSPWVLIGLGLLIPALRAARRNRVTA